MQIKVKTNCLMVQPTSLEVEPQGVAEISVWAPHSLHLRIFLEELCSKEEQVFSIFAGKVARK